ncbi:gas vesicle protein K [Streptomyces sp. WI04-05B]|nr:gas vesicle protein K [Streptomyces sp. WI04-05B]MDX2585161.1 gas vesicle protein K [Streptomyces sp. WI04-05A]MDX3752293.1 gas vesicle protein K [Streptomyces sp. AK08-02]
MTSHDEPAPGRLPGSRTSPQPLDSERPLPLGAQATPAPDPGQSPARRLDLDKDTVERDLVRLVLTVVELLRQLMERQAIRRVERNDLTEEQEERIGMTLMILDDRMTELRERYGLSPEDLNLDLGPLGPLLPRQEGSY